MKVIRTNITCNTERDSGLFINIFEENLISSIANVHISYAVLNISIIRRFTKLIWENIRFSLQMKNLNIY